MEPTTLPGFRDFYPELTALRTHIFAAWRRVAERYGFEEYDGPPLEPLDLYTRKSGEEIVGQLYAFEDRGGRQVALRPEMTPTLARMVAARAAALKKPIRWYAMPQLFRYERQQRGRLREHFQLNVDLIGESGPLADAEVVAVAIDVMRAVGLSAREVQARISDRRVLRAMLARRCGLGDAAMPAAFAAIDKSERAERDALLAGMARRGLTVRESEAVLEVAAVRSLEAVREVLGPDAAELESLEGCVEALDAMGLAEFVTVDLTIVRGLAYYTGVVFELFDTGRTMRAICGGGRYDGLLQSLGGVDLPGVGFGMGDVVLGDMLTERGWTASRPTRLDVFLVGVTEADRPEVLRLAHGLRDAGVRTEFALKPQSVVKQLKLAAARPARWAMVVGPDERSRGRTMLRDLRTGTEREIAMDIDALKAAVAHADPAEELS